MYCLDKARDSDDNRFVQKSPEQWLEVAAPEKTAGIFKIFLGYAPGVGKTYSMLSEGIRRYSRGEDVVVGVVETHGRKAVADLVAKMEIALAMSEAEREAYRAKAVQRVRERYSWDAVTDAYERLLARLAKL